MDLAARSGIRKLDCPHVHARHLRGGDQSVVDRPAPDDVRHYFSYRENSSFTIDTVVIETVKYWGRLPS